MNKGVFLSIVLLSSSILFSQQSLAAFGAWSPKIENGGVRYCLHSTGERYNFSMVKFEVLKISGGKFSERYMTLLSGSSAAFAWPQIMYSDDRLKKQRPNFPIVLLPTHRAPLSSGRRFYMGYNTTEAGQEFACRFSDVDMS